MQLENAVRSAKPDRPQNTVKHFSADMNDQSGSAGPAQIDLGTNLAQLISEDGTELTKFRFIPSGRSTQLDINPNFFFTISNVSLLSQSNSNYCRSVNMSDSNTPLSTQLIVSSRNSA